VPYLGISFNVAPKLQVFYFYYENLLKTL